MTEEIDNTELPVKKTLSPRAVIIVIISLVGVAGVVWLSTQPPVGGAGVALGKLDEKLSVFEVRLQNLEDGVHSNDSRISKLEKDIKLVSGKVSELSVSASQKPEKPDVSTGVSTPDIAQNPPTFTEPPESTKRLEALEKEFALLKASAPMHNVEQVAHSIKLLSSFHRLSNNVMAGKAYAEALSDFEGLIGDSTSQNKPLMQLATYADNGVPTLAELLTSFDNATEQLYAAQAIPPAEAGAWDRFVFNLKHLVRVKRIDEAQTGHDTDAVVGRAAANLEKGQIEAAVAEINSLPDTAKEDFSGWLEDAQIAMDVQGIIDDLEEQVMQQVFLTSDEPKTTSDPATNQGLTIQ